MEKALILAVLIATTACVIKYLLIKQFRYEVQPTKIYIAEFSNIAFVSFAFSYLFFTFDVQINDIVALLFNRPITKIEHTQIFSGAPDF